MSNELEQFVNNNRDSFDDKVPDPAVLQRLQKQMQMQGMDKKKGIVISFRVVRWAAACVIALAGAGIFYIVQEKNAGPAATIRHETAQQQPVPNANDASTPKETPSLAPATTNPAIAKLAKEDTYERELNEHRQVLMAKLSDMASPGTRVAAATELNKLKNADKDIVDALVSTMNNDPNTNVRLAALDALTRFHRETYVKQQLVKSLKKQNDPMVQIQLIQLLTRMRQTTIVDQLEKMVKDETIMDAVKENAYTGILTLKS